MSGFATVWAREVRERWMVLAAAAVAALIPVLAPLLPGVTGAGDARAVTGWFVAVTLAAGFGLLLGASVLARDLTEGRLGFYFAQPLRGLAIWSGKMAAAAALAVVSALLPLAATVLAGALPGAGGHGVGGGWVQGLAALVGLAVTAVALGHAASVVVRSRSRWQVLDAVGLVVVVAATWWALATLQAAWAGDALMVTVWVLLVAPPLALLVAGAVQTVRGRTDVVRGHRLLSLTLWSLLGLVVLVVVAGARWVVTPEPGDLVVVNGVTPAPTGTWLAVSGASWGRGDLESSFLMDPSSGRWLRLPSAGWQAPARAFAGDGRRAVWVAPPRHLRDPLGQLVLADLDRGALQPRATTISMPYGWGTALAVSPHGDSVATVTGGTVTVSSLPDGRLLAAVRLPAELRSPAVLYLTPERLRLYGWRGADDAHGELWIGELDVATHRLAATGSVPGVPRFHWGICLDPEAERMAVWRSDPQSLHAWVADATSGAPLLELEQPGWLLASHPALLADGSVAVAERGAGGNRLRLVAADGGERTIPLPSAPGYRLGFEAAPGTLLMAAGAGERWQGEGSFTTLAVDVASGAVRELGAGIPGPLVFSRVERTPAVGSPATRLVTTNSTVKLVDPVTGRRTLVAGRG